MTAPLNTEPNIAERTQSSAQTPLFRDAAVAHQTRRLDGDVLLMQALPMRVLGVIGVAIVVAAAIFVSTATYSRMESVSGWVVPEGGLIRVTARQGGVIESVAASEGDVVAVGQSLANLRLSSNLETGDAGTALVGQLEAEIAAAQAQALATREKLAAEEELVRAQRAALSLELEENRRRLSSIDDRATLLKANVDRAKQLSERGFVSRKGLEEAQLVELTAQQDISQMRATILSYERQVGDLDARLRALPLDVAAADAQARVTQAALAQKRTEAAVRQNYVVGATVKGRVVAVPITKGQDVQAGGVVAVLTPADSSLEAELFIPSRAAGFIRQGQDVRLMYHAFPYQKFGSAHGTVSLVSRTVLGPNEINIPGVEVQEPVFRVKVELERESIDAYGQEIPIQPGMLLSADVIIDRRTLLEWLLDPIYAAGRMG